MAKIVALPEELQRERIIGTSQTAALYGKSVAHLRRLYRAKKIPAPIKIGERKYGWRVGAVLDDIAAKSAASFPKAA